jgi:hypothetical protein
MRDHERLRDDALLAKLTPLRSEIDWNAMGWMSITCR